MRPPIMVLRSPADSPLTMTIQYLSCLYVENPGGDSRVWLLISWLGFSSPSEHLEGDVASWKRLRVALRSTMTSIWRQHVHELSQYPWTLLSLVDAPAPQRLKHSIIQDWESEEPCCLPEGLARRFKDANVDFMSSDTQIFRFWFAFMVQLTVADVEVRHARNQVAAGATGNVDFANIVASCIAAEYSELKRSAVLSLCLSSAPPCNSDNAGGGQANRRKRKQAQGGHARPRRRGRTAIQCFLDDRSFGHLKSGGRMTKEFWDIARAEFGNLPLERKQAYEAQSQLSCHPAREARLKSQREQLIESTPATVSGNGNAVDNEPIMESRLPCLNALSPHALPHVSEEVAHAPSKQRHVYKGAVILRHMLSLCSQHTLQLMRTSLSTAYLSIPIVLDCWRVAHGCKRLSSSGFPLGA